MVALLFVALVADLKGWNRVYILLNWPSSLLATFIYFVANSTPIFLIGKLAEAMKQSSYWAVNRTAIFSLSPKREETEATRNTAVLFLSTAIGSAVTGLSISYFGFSTTLTILMVAAGVIGVPAALLWKPQKQNFELRPTRMKSLINLRNYGKNFWFVSITLLFFGLAYYPF